MTDVHIVNGEDYGELLNCLEAVVAIMERSRVYMDRGGSAENREADIMMELASKLGRDPF